MANFLSKLFGRGTPETPQEILQRGLDAMTQGDAPRALELADFILLLFDRDPELKIHHGIAYMHAPRLKAEALFALQRYDDSLAPFDEAIRRKGPGSEELFLWKAMALANAGRKPEAISGLKKWLGSPNASNPELVGKARQAIEAFAEAP